MTAAYFHQQQQVQAQQAQAIFSFHLQQQMPQYHPAQQPLPPSLFAMPLLPPPGMFPLLSPSTMQSAHLAAALAHLQSAGMALTSAPAGFHQQTAAFNNSAASGRIAYYGGNSSYSVAGAGLQAVVAAGAAQNASVVAKPLPALSSLSSFSGDGSSVTPTAARKSQAVAAVSAAPATVARADDAAIGFPKSTSKSANSANSATPNNRRPSAVAPSSLSSSSTGGSSARKALQFLSPWTVPPRLLGQTLASRSKSGDSSNAAANPDSSYVSGGHCAGRDVSGASPLPPPESQWEVDDYIKEALAIGRGEAASFDVSQHKSVSGMISTGGYGALKVRLCGGRRFLYDAAYSAGPSASSSAAKDAAVPQNGVNVARNGHMPASFIAFEAAESQCGCVDGNGHTEGGAGCDYVLALLSDVAAAASAAEKLKRPEPSKKRPRSASPSAPPSSSSSASAAVVPQRGVVPTATVRTPQSLPALPASMEPLLLKPAESLSALLASPPHLTPSQLEAVAKQGIVIPRRCISWLLATARPGSGFSSLHRSDGGKTDTQCSVCDGDGYTYNGPEPRTCADVALFQLDCAFCPTSVHAGCVGLEPLLLSPGENIDISGVGTSGSVSNVSSDASDSALLPQFYPEDLYACPRCAKGWLFKDKLPFPPKVDTAAEVAALLQLDNPQRRGTSGLPKSGYRNVETHSKTSASAATVYKVIVR